MMAMADMADLTYDCSHLGYKLRRYMHDVLVMLTVAVIIVQGHPRSSQTTWFDRQHTSYY